MILVVSIFAALLFFFLFLGIYVFIINPGKRENIIFFCVSLCISVMAAGGVIMQGTGSPASARGWYKIGASVGIVMIFLFQVFALEISRAGKKKFFIYGFFGAAAALLIGTSAVSGPMVIFTAVKGIRRIESFAGPGRLMLYSGYVVLSMVSHSVILFFWKRRTRSIKEKLQASILLYGFLGAVFLFLGHNIVFFHQLEIISLQIPGIDMLFFLPWFFGIFYGIVRFRLLSVTPEFVSRELIESIDESIILLDGDGKIVFSNDKIGVSPKAVKNANSGLGGLIVECRALEEEIGRLLKGEFSSFVCRCTYRAGDERQVPVNAKFSLVKDSFGDALGIMVVAKRVKEMKQLRALYRLTRREGEILEQMILGLPYKEITNILDISRNTLKRHIANIYVKLGVKSRLALISILKDYDLVPAEKADRTVLLTGHPAEPAGQ
jgi:DNA-binding CsgD family transcriptional regulator